MLRPDFWPVYALCAGLVSVGAAAYFYRWVRRQDAGSQRAQEVASWIREGARTYLWRLYRALTLTAVVLGFIIAIVFGFEIENLGTGSAALSPGRGFSMALAFIAGASSSAVGYSA